MRETSVSPQTQRNRAYKQKIYKLCSAVVKGNRVAEIELEEELDKNSQAHWAVKHWLKVHHRKSLIKSASWLSSDPKIRTKKKPRYGNAFKPFQGGALELGKK